MPHTLPGLLGVTSGHRDLPGLSPGLSGVSRTLYIPHSALALATWGAQPAQTSCVCGCWTTRIPFEMSFPPFPPELADLGQSWLLVCDTRTRGCVYALS